MADATLDPSPDEQDAPSEPVEVATTPRRRGRPKGSKNRVGADARELLRTGGIDAIKKLIDIGCGRAIYRVTRGGHREKLVPELADMLQAQKMILDRLAPSLKAVEQDITTTRNDVVALPNDRQLARQILHVLGKANLAPVRAEIQSKDLARVLITETPASDEGDLQPAGANGKAATPLAAAPEDGTDPGPVASASSLSSDDRPPPQPGERILIGNRGVHIVYDDVTRKWRIFDHLVQHITSAGTRERAEQLAVELDQTGGISR